MLFQQHHAFGGCFGKDLNINCGIFELSVTHKYITDSACYVASDVIFHTSNTINRNCKDKTSVDDLNRKTTFTFNTNFGPSMNTVIQSFL